MKLFREKIIGANRYITFEIAVEEEGEGLGVESLTRKQLKTQPIAATITLRKIRFKQKNPTADSTPPPPLLGRELEEHFIYAVISRTDLAANNLWGEGVGLGGTG